MLVFPRSGLKELIPCETERVHHINMAFKVSTLMVFGLDYAGYYSMMILRVGFVGVLVGREEEWA